MNFALCPPLLESNNICQARQRRRHRPCSCVPALDWATVLLPGRAEDGRAGRNL